MERRRNRNDRTRGRPTPSARSSHRGIRFTAAITVVVIAIALAATPALAVTGYDGPGTRGQIPRGDGGLDAQQLGMGENLTTATITDIPLKICRIDLVPDQGTHLIFDPNNTTAKVYADAGAEDAPWEVHSEWIPDINGNCTVEITEDGITYHDPLGRAFVKLHVRANESLFTVQQGASLHVGFTVVNTGTVTGNISAEIRDLSPGWEIEWNETFFERPLGPDGWWNVTLRLDVPETARVGLWPFELRLETVDPDAEKKLVVPVQVERFSVFGSEADRPDWATNETLLNEQFQASLEDENNTTRAIEESPMPAPMLAVGMLSMLAVIAARRRR